MLFPPFEPDRDEPKRRRFRPIPVRTLVPNLITLLALCAGLTAVRLAIEGKLEFALAAIVLAAVLDGIDGRIARLIKGTSRFGAELDSLADFVNFGVAPALILYFWDLHELRSAGWVGALGVGGSRDSASRPMIRTGRPGRRISSSACPRPRARSRSCCRSTSISSALRHGPRSRSSTPC